MSLRRLIVLLGKEFSRGLRSFMFIFAIVVPLVITLVVTLLFGTLFSNKPRLGVTDEGNSQFVQLAGEDDSLVFKQYDSPDELHQAVESGAVDLGMILPPSFDQNISSGEAVEITGYVWGQSLLKDRALLGTAVLGIIHQITGQESPVDIIAKTIGESESIPWEVRLLPFVVMMAVLFGGIMVPASSLVDEKQKRTLTALTVTPTSLGEVYLAKGLLGVFLSTLMGVLVLILNRAFGVHPWLLVLELALGACMASALGVLFGAFLKDINSLFATIKGLGILLYAPALVYMFPDIPQWIGRIFPTFYMIQPVIEITQNGASWADVLPETLIMVALILALVLVIAVVSRRTVLREA